MQKFMAIGQTVIEIWRFLIFQNGGRPPSWIFKNEILILFRLKRVKMRHYTKLHSDSLNRR